LAQAKVLNQWRELGTTDSVTESVAEIVAYEELQPQQPDRSNVESDIIVTPASNDEKINIIEPAVAFNDEPGLIETPIAFNDEPDLRESLMDEESKLFDSPAAFNVALVTKEEDRRLDPKTTIDNLARDIARDLKARRSDSALEKIIQLKELDPSHDYAVNGESYVALMGGN